MNQQITSKTYTGEAFAKALEAGPLKTSIARVGMVKRAEGNSKVVLFSESGCDGWIEVPIEMIDEVAHLASTTCEDHEHPLVEIRFKEPEDPAARVFADLARSVAAGVVGMDAGGGSAVPGAVFRQRDDDATFGTNEDELFTGLRCLARTKVYYLTYIRIAPGVHIPVLRWVTVCKSYT